MKCEVEFLAVGKASRPGDAIVIRYGEPDVYSLMIVDGGTEDTGAELVEHIRKQFGNYSVIEHVVLTHCDGDHSSGLRNVLRELQVKNLWINIPWLLSEHSIHLFKSNWTVEGLSKEIKSQYPIIEEIFELAVKQGCNIRSALAGQNIGPFIVTSPSRAAYSYLLPQFPKTPEPDQGAIEAVQMWIGKPNIFDRILQKALKKVDKWIEESWTEERLRDGGITSASNESSVVLYANLNNQRRLLLTGDAGVWALWWTIKFAKDNNYPLQQFDFVQIPHHGSRRNVGPSVLNELLGPKELTRSNKFFAFVSAPADDSDHPRQIVLNAFMRRGGLVQATQGVSKVYYGGFAPRNGYGDVPPFPFSTKVEDYT